MKTSQAPAFKLDGQPLETKAQSLRLKKIMQHLTRLPDGELLTYEGLATAIGSTKASVSDLNPADYGVFSTMVRHAGHLRRVFGNEKTIKYLISSLAAEA